MNLLLCASNSMAARIASSLCQKSGAWCKHKAKFRYFSLTFSITGGAVFWKSSSLRKGLFNASHGAQWRSFSMGLVVAAINFSPQVLELFAKASKGVRSW